MNKFFIDRGFVEIKEIQYYKTREEIYSKIYYSEKLDVVLILDFNISEIHESKTFSYREYTNIQNQLMKKHKYLYRFCAEKIDKNRLENIIDRELDIPLESVKNINRTGIDASYLEHHFETVFFEIYGEDSYNLLLKEEQLIGFDGENIFADYVIEKIDEKIIIEENGESYHHPQKTGLSKYIKQIERQNALVYQGYKVFRFSTNEIEFKDRMIEEMRIYLGSKEEFIPQNFILKKREYKLYEHQTLSLDTLQKIRKDGVKSSVVVLPTGTGKSTIAVEDIKLFLSKNKKAKVLILVPTTALKNQWIDNLKNIFINYSIGDNRDDNIYITTYSGIISKKNNFSSEEFNYIVVDEAHHSVAPGMEKVLKYFNPEFLLGMTATPERLDNKKLEEIFSKVETNLSLKEAIEKNICSPIRVFRLESNIDLSEVRFNGKDYMSGDLEKRIVVSSRNELIADTVDKYFGKDVKNFSEKQGIIFCVNVKHAEMMAKLLNEKGISAAAVSGKDKKSLDYIEQYLKGEIRFLTSCQLISEGWNAPKTSVVVMARPTMSKVIYYQQLGRGTRKADGKEALYLIDVVDNYSFNSAPWTANSLFKNPLYSAFGDALTGVRSFSGEMIYLDHLLETEVDLQEIDIETFENLYGDYISAEELARELFLSTDTINSWLKKGDITPDYTSKLGRVTYNKFKPERIEEIRLLKGLKKRNETTILDDFWEFIEEGSYSLSYKIIFMLSLLKNLEKDGEADFDKVKEDYIIYYKERLKDGLDVDKKSCPYTLEYLNSDKDMIRNIIVNPFEKFERKRFIYYGNDVKNIGFSFYLWQKMDDDFLNKLKSKMIADLKEYYKDLGGAGNIAIFE
ncbi:DEAD/DEAH box helicase [Cetobacterium sp.]|uniref:DEAD/DEAH box helicase n=1 Tax=Cetobacterium sp. TaxID=2071632 RepID=UPI003F67FE4B